MSLGGGTQSTVMALLADRGELGPEPDFAVFADTGWEAEAVYRNVEWLAEELSYPVVTVTAGGRSLRADVAAGVNVRGRPWTTIPVFLAAPDGRPAGMNWRQCTSDYKIAPIQREVRHRLGLVARSPVPVNTSVEMWLGITVDEAERMRTSPEHWIANRYPLVDAGMSRADCIEWFASEHPDRTLPRSACIGCPYHSDDAWLEMRRTDPGAFADAVAVDALLRTEGHSAARMFRNSAFLHRRRRPLPEAVAMAEKERSDEGHWGNECAGVCGV